MMAIYQQILYFTLKTNLDKKLYNLQCIKAFKSLQIYQVNNIAMRSISHSLIILIVILYVFFSLGKTQNLCQNCVADNGTFLCNSVGCQGFQLTAQQINIINWNTLICSGNSNCYYQPNNGLINQLRIYVFCNYTMMGCNNCQNSQSCQACSPGFYLTLYDPDLLLYKCKSCRQTIGGCEMCSSSTYCSQCNHQYLNVLGICYTTGGNLVGNTAVPWGQNGSTPTQIVTDALLLIIVIAVLYVMCKFYRYKERNGIKFKKFQFYHTRKGNAQNQKKNKTRNKGRKNVHFSQEQAENNESAHNQTQRQNYEIKTQNHRNQEKQSLFNEFNQQYPHNLGQKSFKADSNNHSQFSNNYPQLNNNQPQINLKVSRQSSQLYPQQNNKTQQKSIQKKDSIDNQEIGKSFSFNQQTLVNKPQNKAQTPQTKNQVNHLKQRKDSSHSNLSKFQKQKKWPESSNL